MAAEVKKEATESIMTEVLATQNKLQKLLKKIKRLANTYTGLPGHWTGIMLEIIGTNAKSGMLQELSAVQSDIRNLPEINYDAELQKVAANLGDEFISLQELQTLIVSETFVAKSKEELGAVLDEIKRKCDLINTDIKDTRTAVANVASAL